MLRCSESQEEREARRKNSHLRPLRPAVCIISGFFVTMKGRLFIPLRRDEYFDIQLNQHVFEVLRGKEVRSLTITPDSLSLCYSEDIEPMPIKRVYGVDRNEKNLTFGDKERVTSVDMGKAVRIKRTTREIMRSLKRVDVRVRRKLARKYWRRANHRTDQILHAATNFILDSAAKDGAALRSEEHTSELQSPCN